MLQIATPAYRHTDPDTSRLASDQITRTGVRAAQQAQALAAVRAFPGLTSFELARRSTPAGGDMIARRFVLARRLPEVEAARLVRKGPKRQCGVSGKLAVTWLPVEPGDQLPLPEVA